MFSNRFWANGRGLFEIFRKFKLISSFGVYSTRVRDVNIIITIRDVTITLFEFKNVVIMFPVSVIIYKSCLLIAGRINSEITLENRRS